MLHQDHKKLGRIPDGGGHRVHRRSTEHRSQGASYDHFEVSIDDAARLGFAALVEDERPATAVDA